MRFQTATVVGLLLLWPPSSSAQLVRDLMVTESTFLYVRPSAQIEPLARVEAGVLFQVVSVEGDWYLIEYQHPRWGRRVGYIHKNHVRAVEPQTKPPSRVGPKPVVPVSPNSDVNPSSPSSTQTSASEPAALSVSGKPLELNGYLEWHRGDHIVVDGQRVRWHSRTRVRLRTASSIVTAPVGSEVKVEGVRLRDGSVLARSLEIKPNGIALFEKEVRAASNAAERAFIEKAAFLRPTPGGVQSLGAVITSGADVDRCRAILDRLLPPSTSASALRIYIVDTQQWNAMVMPNGAVWVFRGLLDAMDDHELAAVLGHELAHYTHEHVRRGQKRAFWGEVLGAVAQGAASQMSSSTASLATQLGAFYALNAWVSGYSRDQEDQADRVGLRYAYEAGFDVNKGAQIWRRFGEKYPDGDRVTNFFFGTHSLSVARLANLQLEIRHNYPR